MKRMSNKIIFTILFLFFILSFNFVLAASGNITCDNYKYPWCGTKELGGSEGLIGKFYTFALAAVGVAALGAIIYGGILHTVSAGSASQQTEARAWIWGAVMGVMLLLGAYLLLNTINPELVKLKDPGGLIEKVKIKKETADYNCVANPKFCGTAYQCDLNIKECVIKDCSSTGFKGICSAGYSCQNNNVCVKNNK